MESSRIKRKSLMASSYVSLRPWPDIPARFESLNNDTLTTVLEFVGDNSYKSFGGLNKHCKEIYIGSGMEKKTFLFGYAPLSVIIDKIERTGYDWELHEALSKGVVLYNRSDVLAWLLQRNEDVLGNTCNVSAEEGRIDLLNKVWNNVEDEDKRFVFHDVDVYAAYGGKLNVLKWFETKGFNIDKYECVEAAARHGQLHLLKWLREERGLELLLGDMYDYAIEYGHLHIMKWLKEQEVDWDPGNFAKAAEKGNLEVLQWLHNEGFPWDESPWYSVHDVYIKPEVIDWLRSNGYGNRIVFRDV